MQGSAPAGAAQYNYNASFYVHSRNVSIPWSTHQHVVVVLSCKLHLPPPQVGQLWSRESRVGSPPLIVDLAQGTYRKSGLADLQTPCLDHLAQLSGAVLVHLVDHVGIMACDSHGQVEIPPR